MGEPPKPPPGCEEMPGAPGVWAIRDPAAFMDSIRPSIEANTAQQRDAERERAGDGWQGSIGGACPVQGEGTVDCLPWYFRARGERWTFGVAGSPDGDPVLATFRDAPEGSWWAGGPSDDGGPWSASWMGYAEAWRHIEASIAAFRARGPRDG